MNSIAMTNAPDLKNRRVLVLGLGTSGIAACRLCRAKGAHVLALDRKEGGQLNGAHESLREEGVEIVLTRDTTQEPFDLMICSPGIPLSHPMVEQCRQRNVPVCSEIELASWYCPGPIIAVTGTDGKSTVVSLVYQILRNHDRKARLVGNIGYAFSQMIVESPPDASTLCVVEVSSYQLELTDRFRPHIAAILNIAPDHLDRHKTLEDYAQAKYRITEKQDRSDFLIRPLALPGSFESKAEALFWACQPHDLPGLHFDPGTSKLTLQFRGKTEAASFPALSRLMPHQQENFLAALAICLPLGIEPTKAVESMLAFPGLPHRLEYLGTWSGVAYYNDSKATNVHSCQAALRGMQRPAILLAGGLAKNEDYSQLSHLLERKAKLAIVFGRGHGILKEAWQSCVPVISVSTLEQATRLAVERAEPGDVVLLSPACASFDRFQNFEQRGNFFKSLVTQWVIEKES